ncbi:MAG: thiosulfate oxidation carrier protein SoxY [Hyphomicrobiales bacterium]|nr:thiosulfate oxidation carrier protein SoxY [Hyphomicrobiales bacterium]
MKTLTRRTLILGAGASAATALLIGRAAATTQARDAAVAELTGGAAIKDGRVRLTIPAVAENGLSVYTTIAVDSPMTEADHVRAIHIISEKNPIARLFTARFSPRSRVAKLSTNLRLASSQQVTALAEMSDGSFWRDRKDVIVTIAACIDGG